MKWLLYTMFLLLLPISVQAFAPTAEESKKCVELP